jgi:hypothetical protein
MKKAKTDLDWMIDTTKKMIEKWARLMRLYVKYRASRQIPSKVEKESMDILNWLQRNYPIIGSKLKSVVTQERIDPALGIHIKHYDPILNLVMSIGSLSELLSHRFREELEGNLRTGRNNLNAFSGFLERRRTSVGEISIDEYKKFRSFFEQNVREAERLSQREDLIRRLSLRLKHFEIAQSYFDEAKSCFKYGFFRASTIMAISALESCLRTDYRRIREEEYEGKLFTLLNRYFSGDVKRLPKQYEDFSRTYVKIRNAFTHPELFDYSETIVFNLLSTTMELMKAIESRY